ncbi:hypothetical protein Holit_03261 [Hollandina sp. SP2]
MTVIFVPLMVPCAGRAAKLKPVISFASEEDTETVTVYSTLVLSPAVTVYVTGLLKSCAVSDSGLTLTPAMVIVGVRLVRSVPKGTVTVIFVPSMVPIAGGEAKLKPVIALASRGGGSGMTVTV